MLANVSRADLAAAHATLGEHLCYLLHAHGDTLTVSAGEQAVDIPAEVAEEGDAMVATIATDWPKCEAVEIHTAFRFTGKGWETVVVFYPYKCRGNTIRASAMYSACE